MTKVLITDNAHEELANTLRKAGIEAVVKPGLDKEAMIEAAQGCEGLVVRSKVLIGRDVIDRLPGLRCVGRLGAGMETIDVEYARERGIVCINSPEGNRTAVGEHSVGLLLALIDNIARADAEVRRGMWQRESNRGHELNAMTVGIVGCGNMGCSFAQCLSGFGCRVVGYDKNFTQENAVWIEPVRLEELQEVADVVSFHVPLTDETRHYFSKTFVERMRKPFYLINTARGAVVDTEALVEGLKSGKVLGAALDVVEYENMQVDGLGEENAAMDYLRKSPHTVLTPHVAGWTVESKYKMALTLAEKMIRVLAER